MTKTAKWLTGLVLVLILLNGILLAMMWRGRNGHPPPAPGGDARNYLITTLALSNQQVQSFDSLRKMHFERIRTAQDSIRYYKDALFAQLSGPAALQAEGAANAIGQWQAKMDLETFRHFRQLRSLLNAPQTQKFDAVIEEVLHTMAPPDRHPGGPPGPGHFQG